MTSTKTLTDNLATSANFGELIVGLVVTYDRKLAEATDAERDGILAERLAVLGY